jgi:hypothetical protein
MLFTNYINLLFSTVGILVNLVMILILWDFKGTMKEKMYRYMFMTSCFNFIFSILLTLNFTLKHLEENSIHYARFYLTIYSQYINLFIGKFGSNLFRSSANLSYLAFTISRYIKITTTKNKHLNNFQKLNLKISFCIIFLISVLVNAHVYFQFRIDLLEDNFSEKYKRYQFKNVSSYIQEPFEDYKNDFSSKSEYLLVNMSQYIRLIFSDLAHIILLTVFDVSLLVHVKRQIKLKKRLTQSILIQCVITQRQKYLKKKQQNQSKDRLSTIIMLNGINFLFLRLPLALSSFYGFMFTYSREQLKYEPNLFIYIMCKPIGLCRSLKEIFTCFYFLSFILQFFIFYKLDTNFKLRISNLKNICFKRTQSN